MIQLRFTFALGLLASTLAIAQQPAPAAPGHAGGGDFLYVRSRMGMQKLVKGQPYSAQAVTQFTQTLADGNHIQHTTTASVARDSEGRWRREVAIASIGALAGSGPAAKSVFIHDPVAGTSYALEPDTHTARLTHRPGSGAAETEAAHSRTFHGDAAGQPGRMGRKSQATTEELGTQVMEGLTVQGKRITRTIPAGQVGNERPLQSVTEIWYSQELQTIVMSKTNDPRSGESVYQLKNVSRTEPDAALFQVPADYKVVQGGGMGNHGPRAKQ